MIDRYGEPWTDVETRAVLRLYEAGVPLKQIAVRVGRTVNGVTYRLNSSDVPRMRKRMLEDVGSEEMQRLYGSMTLRQMAAHYGVHVSTLKRQLNKRGIAKYA